MHSINENIIIKLPNGYEITAYLSKPSNNEAFSAPTVIVIGDNLNRSDAMTAVCDSLAYNGYVAICPDLDSNISLDSNLENDYDNVSKMADSILDSDVANNLFSLIEVVKNDSKYCCNSKIATMGYCLGANLSYLVATNNKTNCNISYCMMNIEDKFDTIKNIKKPFMLHIAEESPFIDMNKKNDIKKAIEGHTNIEAHFYNNTRCGFSYIGNDNYDDEQAKLANYNSIDFLARCMSENVEF